ncbi:MAG TPA: DNA primase, partial [Bifidobacterium sp.]|nr:DNA primase [Bifidobacterium sp.]
HVRDEDAYAPKRRYSGGGAERMERGMNPYANPSVRKALEHRDAAEQSYYRMDDAVFICEQQFMATLIQVPLAVDPT